MMADHAQKRDTPLPQRICIIGKSGSGKTTLARRLSKITGAPHLEIDSIFWKPHWTESDPREMRATLDHTLGPNQPWIADGSYLKYADLTWSRADLIIWLDYPLWWVLWHLVIRTLWRIFSGEKVCGENRESFAGLISPGSQNILVDVCKQVRRHRVRFPKLMVEMGVEGKVLRLRSVGEMEGWLRKFQEMGRGK